MSNSFTVTATTTSGGTAQQSWTVTPGGTITVNWQNNYWTATGKVQVPALPSAAANLSALVTNPDGSVTVQKGSWTSAGVFNIPNVPGGYYWLQIGATAYWTSTSTFDAGSDIAGPQEPIVSGSQITSFEFSLSGLDSSIAQPTWVEFVAPVQGVPGFTMTDPANSGTITSGLFGFGTVDIGWSQIDSAFLLQYRPVSLDSANTQINNQALDYSWEGNPSVVDGQTNTITETLQQASPQESVNLSVPGSQWASLFTTNAAPATPTAYSSALAISTEPYMTGGSFGLGKSRTDLALGGNQPARVWLVPGTSGHRICIPIWDWDRHWRAYLRRLQRAGLSDAQHFSVPGRDHHRPGLRRAGIRRSLPVHLDARGFPVSGILGSDSYELHYDGELRPGQRSIDRSPEYSTDAGPGARGFARSESNH